MLSTSRDRIISTLDETALVLDVGGGAKPFARADWVIDLMGYEERGLYGERPDPESERFSANTWVKRDICDRAPWPFTDKQFDFAVCSHTLEDVRDPIWVCDELVRVAKAGYIEVPSRLEEQSYGFQGPWVGWGHHRWLIDVAEDELTFAFKHGVVGRPSAHFSPDFHASLRPEERVSCLWWRDSFRYRERIFLDAESLDPYLEQLVAEHMPRRPRLARGRRFQSSQSGNRQAHRRHPHAHHIRKLQAGIQVLAGELGLGSASRILDFGCAEMPYRKLFPDDCEYVGADLPGNPDANLVLNADGTVPAPDSSFDAVLSTQVLEHVEDPGVYLSECFRVLRPGGRLLLSTHGIFMYHPDPVDLWRWTGAGLREAVARAGFRVLRFEGIVGLAATGLQLLQDAISFRLSPRWVPWLALAMQPLVAFADRFETAESLGYNAQVFLLVAVRD